MALPTGPATSWLQRTGFPSQLFETGDNDYELYEAEDEFVLSVEMPGFEPDEMNVSWSDGVLNIVAEHEDEQRDRRETYHRRFRFPKDVAEDEITAKYTNGILEVRLPVMRGATVSGTEIEIQG
ncbi:HSP20 family protein [Halogranum amylolyticum]|uniref:HSP20 family protein n=1 Tax=Halogranum amylolyticum TaxID=660520 RepID=A0A1H8PU27_9EURY|nr:Hsp20/alpha crystallin family protein [Halogranum amylolyticum]SEO45184.1 HSP20 family protein [Halogranum amylolyticum]